jgi:hypothetical protein
MATPFFIHPPEYLGALHGDEWRGIKLYFS